MATRALISWTGPEHLYVKKTADWYWAVGIVTLALSAVAIIFGQVITGILIIVASGALALHASKEPRTIKGSINDRGILLNETLYPFVSLESFWIPHDSTISKILLKSRKTFMPLIVIYLDPEDSDPDGIREVLLRYIAETEHNEPMLKHILDGLGF